MTLRQRLLAIAGAAALMCVTFLTGYGEPRMNTTFSLSILGGGPLTASLSAVPAIDAELVDNARSLANRGTATESLRVDVLDERGLASGWTVGFAAHDFRGSAGHIGADALTISPVGIRVRQGNPDLTGHWVLPASQVSSAGAPLWSAARGSGDGEYELTLDGSLRLPANQQTGMYTVILTIRETAP